MRILITGGAGFIGSHLADAFVNRGDEVMALDDLSTGSLKNVRHFDHCSRFRLNVGTIFDSDLLDELVNACDVVVHLAAAVGVRLVIEQPLRTIQTNVNGTAAVLAAALKHQRKVLMASTSEVYGLSTQIPFREDSPLVMGAPTATRWGYACSKAMDEFLAMGYAYEHGLPIVVARLFNTVGPRQTARYGMVLPNFVRQALAGEPITVYGTGSQTRCFCDVRDVVKGLMHLVDHHAAVGQVFNVGSDHEVTINELAQLVKERCDSSSRIVHIPYADSYPTGFEDMPRRVPDLTKLRKQTGCYPMLTLEQTVDRVIACLRSTPLDTSFRQTEKRVLSIPDTKSLVECNNIMPFAETAV